MSSKKKKASTSWVMCEECSAVFHERDKTSHAEVCPSNNYQNHAFVSKKALYVHPEVINKKSNIMFSITLYPMSV